MLKNSKQLSEALWKARAEAKLSIEAASKEAGLSKSTIQRMELRAEFPSMSSLVALARIYQMHIEAHMVPWDNPRGIDGQAVDGGRRIGEQGKQSAIHSTGIDN